METQIISANKILEIQEGREKLVDVETKVISIWHEEIECIVNMVNYFGKKGVRESDIMQEVHDYREINGKPYLGAYVGFILMEAVEMGKIENLHNPIYKEMYYFPEGHFKKLANN